MRSPLTKFYSKNKTFIFITLLCCVALSNSWAQNELITIINVKSLNTKTLEFSPVFHKNQLVFTSTRPSSGSPIIWRNEKKQYSDLFIADRNENGQFYNVKRLLGKVIGPIHDGVATFDQAGTEMFFTRNNHHGKNDQNIVNLKIYSAQLVNDIWQNIQELPFNDEYYANCHPSLSKDGLRLFFASDRPGGYGKMDLYVSEKIKGIWQSPQNLGPSINSKSNELFPYIAQSGTLFFASDDPNSSMGGYDLYQAKVKARTNKFEKAQNLGKDFNSTKDDFGFCSLANEKEGYFSSNRKGGKGGDDLYYWKRTKIPTPPNQLSISVYDNRTNQRMSDALISIFDKEVISTNYDVYPIAKMLNMRNTQMNNPYLTLEKRSYQTGTEGKITTTFNSNKSYTVFIEKEGYLPLKKVLRIEALQKQQHWDLLLTPKAGIPLKVQVVGMPLQKAVPDVTLELYNHCTQKTERAISDPSGKFTFYLSCNCEYEITGKKENFRKYQKKLSTAYRNCGNLNPINTQLYLVDQQHLAYISNPENNRFLSFEAFESIEKHKVGQIIIMNNILFEDTKVDFLPQSRENIYKIHYFLQNNPNIKIEISAHTDSRGAATFNHHLSQKRAENIANFLINNGIPKEQISSVGYGEDRLLNKCQDGIRCSEQEHLQNKRIELKITRISILEVNNLAGKR